MNELVRVLRDVHVLEGVGHFFQIEAHDEVNAAMLVFLADLADHGRRLATSP